MNQMDMFSSLLAAIATLISQWSGQAYATTQVVVPEAQTLSSPVVQAMSVREEIALNANSDLNDNELAMAGGLFMQSGSKGGGGKVTQHMRVCNYAEGRGSGTLVETRRIVRQSCNCNDIEIFYGTPTDLGIQMVTITNTDTEYLGLSCGRSVRYYG
jgi:hypothetical protein